MHRLVLTLLAGVIAAIVLQPGRAQAQWVFVARKVIGRIEHLTQPSDQPATQPGYDVASVILDARPANVYQTVLAALHRRPELEIRQDDALHRHVEFTSGGRSASITVVALGDNVAQLLVGSAIHPGEPSDTSRVLEGVLSVCREMKKVCTVGG